MTKVEDSYGRNLCGCYNGIHNKQASHVQHFPLHAECSSICQREKWGQTRIIRKPCLSALPALG